MSFNIVATMLNNNFTPTQGLTIFGTALSGYALGETFARYATLTEVMSKFGYHPKWIDRIPTKATPPTTLEDREKIRSLLLRNTLAIGSAFLFTVIAGFVSDEAGMKGLANEIYQTIKNPASLTIKQQIMIYALNAALIQFFAYNYRFYKILKNDYVLTNTLPTKKEKQEGTGIVQPVLSAL